MNVLSNFDGMACGYLALLKAGLPITKYYATEIKPHAIKFTKQKYPNIEHLGDICKLEPWYLPKIDLMIGGSPCQDFSFLKSMYHTPETYGLKGEKSKLFFEYLRLLIALRKKNPKMKFFLENVKMARESELLLNKLLGVTGVHINSALVCAQNRQRIYWTNIPLLGAPDDRKIYLDSILETGEHLKKYKVNKTPSRDIMWYGGKCKNITGLLKSSCLTTKMDRWNNAGLIAFEDYCRFLTPVECERLQGVPDNHTQGLTDSQRYDLLGDGWQIDTIVHLFQGLKCDWF